MKSENWPMDFTTKRVTGDSVRVLSVEWVLKGRRGKKLETVNIDNPFEEFPPKGNETGSSLDKNSFGRVGG